MTLDIVMVAYRSACRLEASLPVLHRFSPQARLIVVDNAPEDNASEVVRRLVPEATVITNTSNRGFAAAVNQAFEAGTGELVLLANPDVSAVRGDLAAVEAEFERDSQLGALAVRLLNPDGSLQRNCRTAPRPFDFISETLALGTRFPRWRRPRRFRMLDWNYANRQHVESASGAFLFLRRDAIEDVGPFDERFFVYYEEMDWLVRSRARGWRVLFSPDIEAVHSLGTSSSEAPESLSLLLLESQHRYARKHFGRSRALALRAFYISLDLVRCLRSALPSAKTKTTPRIYRARLRLHLARKLER